MLIIAAMQPLTEMRNHLFQTLLKPNNICYKSYHMWGLYSQNKGQLLYTHTHFLLLKVPGPPPLFAFSDTHMGSNTPFTTVPLLWIAFEAPHAVLKLHHPTSMIHSWSSFSTFLAWRHFTYRQINNTNDLHKDTCRYKLEQTSPFRLSSPSSNTNWVK